MNGMSIDLDKNFFSKFLGNIQKEKKTLLREIADDVKANVQGVISAKNLVNTGNLRRSITTDVRVFGLGGIAVVGTNQIYALPLELGITKRFFPSSSMIKGLQSWARLKLGLSAKAAEKAGAAIAWKIARKGLDPKRFPARFFEEAFKISSRRVPELIERFTRRAAALSRTE